MQTKLAIQTVIRAVLRRCRAACELHQPAATRFVVLFVAIGFLTGAGSDVVAESLARLKDTGITYGAHFPKGVSEDCSARILGRESNINARFIEQQDCATGTSALRASSSATTSEYTKVDARGNPLSSEAKVWSCVVDNVMGLMWEVKNAKSEPANLHFYQDRFTWYDSNPRTNGGDIGNWNSANATCAGFKPRKPRTFCHIEQFADRVNQVGLCGFNDWRVPSRSELISLVDFGRVQPAIEQVFFPHALKEFYWAANPVVGRTLEAWAISFEFGFATPLRKTDRRPVRLVRTMRRRAP